MVAVQSLVVVGICGQSRRSVVVKSMVGGSDEHGWWWWEEKSWPCLVSMMPNKHCLFGPHT